MTPSRCYRCNGYGYVYLGVATIPCPACRPQPYRDPAPHLRPPAVAPHRDTVGAVARAAIGLCVLAVWVRAWVVLARIVGDVLAAVGS